MSGVVYALTVFDDGSGPALYAGGELSLVGDSPVGRVARWDGSNWSAVGAILGETVRALTVFDDGNGARLYAGGAAPAPVAQWNGANWLPVGDLGIGPSTPEVFALEVFDDGTGSALYAGGRPHDAGGIPVGSLAKWNGTSWSAVGNAAGNWIRSLTVFNDGSGSALYAGGGFASINGVPANGIAKWDGSTWANLWSGVDKIQNLSSTVHSLSVFDDGSGPALFAGGDFDLAGGVLAHHAAKWDGANWIALGSGTDDIVYSMAGFESGPERGLFFGGQFSAAGEVGVTNVARWDGLEWHGQGDGLNDDVLALEVFDDGSGPVLYAGGFFKNSGTTVLNHIAKWNGSSWEPLGSGVSGSGLTYVHAIQAYDDGTGAALYVGGRFTSAGGTSALRIAKWNGSSWESLGTGMNADSIVFALAVYDDGHGEELYAGGTFFAVSGVLARRIAKWDGTSWSALGSGLDTSFSDVRTFEIFDDGSGPALIVGGQFDSVGGMTASLVAKWSDTGWGALGGGLTGTRVNRLVVHDDGSGPALFATRSGGATVRPIAKWDGISWASVSTFDVNTRTEALEVFDDGRGAALYVGGRLNLAGELVPIARWDGTSWSSIPNDYPSFTSGIRVLESFDAGAGAALYAGGSFVSATGVGDSFIARLACPSTPFNDFCNGDGGDQLGCTDCPCANNAIPGTIGGCVNSSLSSARLRPSGTPSANRDSLRFEMSGGNPLVFAILASGVSRAPANAANPCFGQDSGLQFPALAGLRCVVQSVQRHGLRAIDVNGDVGVTTNGWGPPNGPPEGLIAQGGYVAGQTRHYQVVYREALTGGCRGELNTSQGVSVTFEP